MNSKFHVVSLGASAGGLSALEQFFAAMPADSGMAFVVIQHLSPDFKSLMDDLLARHTKMTIRHAADGVRLEPNTIYLAPPRLRMGLEAGLITLREKSPGAQLELAIDTFFRSIADDIGSRAIGIVLSGTGSDGSRGLRAIKEAGGLVIVQSPETAQFDGMPRNAIASKCHDYKLSPDRIPRLLVDYVKDPQTVRSRAAHAVEVFPEEGEYAEIFALLRRNYSIDFSTYKITTVKRRIERRMEFKSAASTAEYVTLLVDDLKELDALYCDLLIGVTEFFRDPETFEYLARVVVPELITASADTEQLRIWSACCATGEEAYSLAIVFAEAAEALNYKGKITIFATDIHKKSLETANAGTYSRDRLANVSPERLERFFKQESDNFWRILTNIRQMVVIAPHNVIVDPPFTKTDLVCCRNMLIYLQPAAQERVISMFHYALRVSGILFMGISEGPGAFSSEFEIIDAHHKLFSKKRELRPSFDLKTASLPTQFYAAVRPASAQARTVSIDRLLLNDYDQLMSRYMPPGIIVDEHQHILHIFGPLDPYLNLRIGRPDSHILTMLKNEVHVAVNTTLQRAIRDRATAKLSGVQISQEDGSKLRVTVTVDVINDNSSNLMHLFISFKSEDMLTIPLDHEEAENNIEDQSLYRQHINDLENDLHLTKENLQAANEELQSSNEELQATNEELLASNEELQSTNEELHSVNEELYSVNSEFERKNTELHALYLDLDNLLASIDIGVVFVDSSLCIRKFNTAISDYFSLVPHDIGRPIDHISYRLAEQKSLMDEIRQVQASGVAIETECSISSGNRHILIRILPFKSENGSGDGVVILFADVSRIKKAELQLLQMNESLEKTVLERTKDLKLAQKFTRSVIDGLSANICVVDSLGEIVTVNRSWNDFAVDNYATHGSFGAGVNYLDVLDNIKEKDPEIDEFNSKLKAVLEGRIAGFVDEYPCHSPNESRWFTCTVDSVFVDDERYAVVSHKNITERKKTQIELEQALNAAQAANLAKSQFLANMSHEIRTPMNGLIGLVELLLGAGLTEQQRNYAELAKKSGHNLVKLISNILELSKIEAHKVELDEHSFALGSLIDDTIDMLSLHAREKGTLLTAEIDADVPDLLQGDSLRLRQILTNLIGNAIKFGEKSPVALYIHKERENEQSVVLRFQVCDSGIGIEADKLGEIFSPFHQADGSTSRKFGGTGLGLTITQQLVELMGGEIGVESVKGEGSTFWFTLELKLLADAPETAATLLVKSPPQAFQAEHGIRLLLVEDDEINQLVLRTNLTTIGYQIDVASNGREALKLLEQNDYALVLMDCMMPEVDGYEATAAIRDKNSAVINHAVTIIALTANAFKEDRDYCLAAGMDDYLSKPVVMADLLGMLDKWIGFAPVKQQTKATIVCEAGNVLLNMDELLHRALGNKVLAGNMANMFIDSVPNYLESIGEALTSGDLPALAKTSHKLKGSAATIALSTLSAAAFKMESLAERGELNSAEQLLPELEQQIKQSIEAVRSMLTTL